MYALWGKPMLERAVAALVLGLGAPIFALLALAVLLALGRPILFRQRRAGRRGPSGGATVAPSPDASSDTRP